MRTQKKKTFSPIMEAMAGPLPELVKEKGAEYLRLVITSKLVGRGFLGHMKLRE